MPPPDEINPYTPPETDLDAPAPAPSPAEAAYAFKRPLFSPKQMGVAAFFGTVVAGILLLQANYRAMEQPRTANKALTLGLLASAALFVLVSMLPEGVHTSWINIAAAMAIYKLGQSLQSHSFTHHRAGGGARRSNWTVAAIVIGTAAMMVAVLMTIWLVLGGPT